MKYYLKPAVNDDYEFCYRITKENMYDLFCRHWGGWVDKEFQKGFIVNNIHIIIAEGDRVGYLSVITEYDNIHIDNIQISSNYHNRGIGTQILKNIVCSNTKPTVRLTTFDDNPAKRLYERLGFKIIDNKSGTLTMIKNAQLDDAPEPAST